MEGVINKNHNFKKKILIIFTILILTFNVLNISIIKAEENLPDLIIDNVDLPSYIYEDEKADFIIEIKNIGNKNISAGDSIKVGLFLDNNLDPIISNSTSDGLNKGEKTFVNISWTPSFGDDKKHLLTIKVNYDNNIYESDMNFNDWGIYKTVYEKKTDFDITDLDLPDYFSINETSLIYAKVKNKGVSNDDNITLYFNSSLDGLIKKIDSEIIIDRGEVYTFSFNWTPSLFGIHDIAVEVLYKDEIHDVYKKSVGVGLHEFKWWNSSWHYRVLVSVNNTGNISNFFNFSNFLNDLDAEGSFENDSLRIVRYSDDGSIVGVVDDFWFNESVSFNALNNANGTLYWKVTGSNDKKYYCIYFDVSLNPGFRTNLSENENMTESGNSFISSSLYVDGWFMDFLNPLDNSFTLKNDSIDFNVTCSAYAKNVTMFLSYDDNLSINDTVFFDTDDFLNWSYNDYFFDLMGNWTLTVTGLDAAGYEPLYVDHNLYVGRPDLEINNISFYYKQVKSDTFHKNEIINITGSIKCYNASVEDVDVSLYINNSDGINVFNSSIESSFDKDFVKKISFEWSPMKVGTYDVVMIIDKNNSINESNETNNQFLKSINIIDWPDLSVKNITLPDYTVKELEDVEIEIKVENKGLENATNYDLLLYIEPEDKGMYYQNEKDRKKISVKSGEEITTSLFWNNSSPGKWLVGAKILFNQSKKDINISNNNFLCENILVIKSLDRIKPEITNVTLLERVIKQGDRVTIYADVTDNKGIDKINVEIRNPLDNITQGLMVKEYDNRYRYTFQKTVEIGRYNFSITAYDISVYENFDTFSSNFTVIRETTSPFISFAGAQPFVQLKDKYIDIYCIAYDNLEIDSVEVIVFYPNGTSFTEDMIEKAENYYVYKDIYNILGEYSYYVKVTDTSNNIKISDKKNFWISENINDTDNDGMADWWEQRYGFNPEDPTDAKLDYDNDGFSNLEEYKNNLNPKKDSFLQNTGVRVKNNVFYIILSISMFIILLLITIYAKKRLII